MKPIFRKLLLPAVAALFAAAAFAAYYNALPGPFVLDDGDHIGDNYLIRIQNLSPGGLLRAAFEGPSPNRPVPKLSFALDYYFGGLDPARFRAVNVALHALTAVVLYLFALLTLSTPALSGRYGKSARAAAFFAALLWLLSPLATQSVSYVVQRMNILAALFYLAAFAAYAKGRLGPPGGRRAGWFAACAVFGLLAAGSKENAAMLPAFLALYEWFFFQDLDRAWLVRRGVFYLLASLVFLGAVGLWATGLHPEKTLAGPYAVRDFSMGERLLTQFRVLIHYLSLLVLPLPSRLNLDYDYPLSRGLFDPPSTAACIAAVAALLAASLVLARRQRLASFAILWYFGNLAIESSVIGLEMVFEHSVYLPSALLFLLFSATLFRFAGRPALAAGLCLILALLSGAATHARNEAWSDPVALWSDTVMKSPKKARPRYSLAVALMREGRAVQALSEAQAAVKLAPRDPDAWFNLGRVLEHPDVNRLADAADAYRAAVRAGLRDVSPLVNGAFVLAKLSRFPEAWAFLAPALSADPSNPLVNLTAGRILLYENKPEKALPYLARAILAAPDLALAYDAAGSALSGLARFKEAAEFFARAAALDPQNAGIRMNWGHALHRTGQILAAADRYKEAAALDPGNIQARMTLGALLSVAGRLSEAVKVFDSAAAVDPKNPVSQAAAKRAARARARLDAARAAVADLEKRSAAAPRSPALLVELAVALEGAGNPARARESLEKALALAPASPQVQNDLGLLAMHSENYPEAESRFRRALALDPKNVAALYNLMCLASRVNRRDEAAALLKKLLAAGFSDYTMISGDADLENLRDTAYYRGLAASRPPLAGGEP